MSTTIRWQDTTHPAAAAAAEAAAAAAIRDSLPSEYAFASEPPIADSMRAWDDNVAGALNRQLSDQERMARTIRRKFSGDLPLRKLPTRRNQSQPRERERPRSKHAATPNAKPNRKMSNEERYLKSSVDDRVARALNERKTSNEERGAKFDSDYRSIARLELSRLFNRRKSSKNSAAGVSNTSSTASEAFLTPPPSNAAAPGSYFRLRKSRSRDSPPLHIQSRQSDHSSHKINVRKPPPGIQHWFEGISEEYAVSVKGHSRQSSAEHATKPGDDTRDTFLSASTPRVASSEKIGDQKPRTPLHGRGVLRSPPATSPRHMLRRSKTSPGLRRPESLLSSEVVVASRPASHSKNMSLKRRCLPDAIEESVLVLSETDESDSESPEQDKAPFWMDDGFDGSIQRASRAEVVVSKSPITVRSGQKTEKPLPPIRMSGTIIDDATQMPAELSDDGYSSRTSLLSDLRPLSFRSHVSQSTVHPTDEWDVNVSPTSINFPERAMQRYFDSDPYAELPDLSQRRWDSDGPTHRLMAVTPEEAALLSAMRRKRAQMHADYVDRKQRQLAMPKPLHPRSRSAELEVPRNITSPGMMSEVSPMQTTFAVPERPGSKDTVSRLWQDVRDWRKAHPSPGATPASGSNPPLMSLDDHSEDDDAAYRDDDEDEHDSPEKGDFADFDESYDHDAAALTAAAKHADDDGEEANAAASGVYWRESNTTSTEPSKPPSNVPSSPSASSSSAASNDSDIKAQTKAAAAALAATKSAPRTAGARPARPPMKRAQTAAADGTWSAAGSNTSALEAVAAVAAAARSQHARRRSRWSEDGGAGTGVCAARIAVVGLDDDPVAMADDDDAELDVLAAWNELGGWRRSIRQDSAPT